MVDPQSVGATLKRLRLAAGLTQAELAQHAAISRSMTVSDYERGTRLPEIDSLARIAAALGLSPGSLLDEVTGHAARALAQPADRHSMIVDEEEMFIVRALRLLRDHSPAEAEAWKHVVSARFEVLEAAINDPSVRRKPGRIRRSRRHKP